MTDPGDYEVGYRKPPKTTRFQKGAPSPNPKGRPTNNASILQALREGLAEPVNVTTADGQRTKMPAAKAIAKKIMSQAAAGNVPSQRLLLEQEKRQPKTSADEQEKASTRDPADMTVTDKFIRKMVILMHDPGAESTGLLALDDENNLVPSELGQPLSDLYDALRSGEAMDVADYLDRVRKALDDTAVQINAHASRRFRQDPNFKDVDFESFSTGLQVGFE